MMMMMSALVTAAVASAAAGPRSESVATTSPDGDYLCSRCQAMVQVLHDEQALFNLTASACSANLAASVCVAGYNATEFGQCVASIRQLCVDVLTRGADSVAACSSLGFCRADLDAPTYINPDGFIGECAGCQDLFTVGLDKAEDFVCHGLSSAMSVYCGAGAPICEYVLDEACEWVAHRCDNGCLATLICSKFHACSRGPSHGCCD